MTTTIPANVKLARQQAITTDYYALGYLALCVASYSDEGASPDKVKAAIAANVPTIGQIGDVPGTWTLDWGPAITTNLLSWKANLMFAASYRDPSTNIPIFTAIVIRGTDISAGFLGVVKQLHEDIEPGCQQEWGSGGTGTCANQEQSGSITPYIARGTYSGFKDLIALQGVNQSNQQTQTLSEFLADFLPDNASNIAPLPLIVTGHSLGGCQTSPVSLYVNGLSSVTAGGVTVVPNSFAAPTAGNGGFASDYIRQLPNARRWYNTLDLVPLAFDALSSIDSLWTPCGDPIPGWASAAVSLIKTDVGNLTYAHEGGNSARELTGSCGNTSGSSDPWGAQLEWQHFPPCGYWALMTAQYGSQLGSLNYPAWVMPQPSCV